MSKNKMRPEKTLFYDVDTQRDFMLPGGALHVPGSEKILPVLKQMTEMARRHNIRRLCSTDRHFPTDRELRRNGGQWPDHCMDGTAGQRKVDETAPLNPHPLPNQPLSEEHLDAAIEHPGELIIEKQDVDVIAGNRHSGKLLSRLAQKYDDIVVYGVYTDVCVDYAVKALLERGCIPYVVTDAIHEIDPDNGAAARERWRKAGVKTLTVRELEQRLSA